MSTDPISRYHASYGEWRSDSPHSLSTQAQREAILDHDPPANRMATFRHKKSLSLRPHRFDSIRQPLVPTEVLRAVSPQHWALCAVAQHILVSRPEVNEIPTAVETPASPRRTRRFLSRPLLGRRAFLPRSGMLLPRRTACVTRTALSPPRTGRHARLLHPTWHRVRTHLPFRPRGPGAPSRNMAATFYAPLGRCSFIRSWCDSRLPHDIPVE